MWQMGSVCWFHFSELPGQPSAGWAARCAGVLFTGLLGTLFEVSLWDSTLLLRPSVCPEPRCFSVFIASVCLFLLFINVLAPTNTDHQWFVPNCSFDMPGRWTFWYECHYAGGLSCHPGAWWWQCLTSVGIMLWDDFKARVTDVSSSFSF